MTKKQNCPQIIIFFYCAVEQADWTAVIWCGRVKDAWRSASELFCILSLFSLFQCQWVLSLTAARNIFESTNQIWELFHSDFIITLNQVDSSCINWFLVFWAQSMSTRWQMQDARAKWDNFVNKSSTWLSSAFLYSYHIFIWVPLSVVLPLNNQKWVTSVNARTLKSLR